MVNNLRLVLNMYSLTSLLFDIGVPRYYVVHDEGLA